LPGSQVDLRPVRNLENLLGERLQFKIIKFNQRRGNIVLSRRALLEKEREKMRATTLETLQEGQIIDGVIKNITDYGAFIDLGGIDGLLHVTDMSWGRVNHPSELFRVGDEIKVKVLKFDAESERVSLGLKQIQPDPWVDAAMRYPIGVRIKGKVVSLTDYGAFIELEPGIEGLVHVSEMSWTKRVKHPSKVVAIGDEVEAATNAFASGYLLGWLLGSSASVSGVLGGAAARASTRSKLPDRREIAARLVQARTNPVFRKLVPALGEAQRLLEKSRRLPRRDIAAATTTRPR